MRRIILSGSHSSNDSASPSPGRNCTSLDGSARSYVNLAVSPARGAHALHLRLAPAAARLVEVRDESCLLPSAKPCSHAHLDVLLDERRIEARLLAALAHDRVERAVAC